MPSCKNPHKRQSGIPGKGKYRAPRWLVVSFIGPDAWPDVSRKWCSMKLRTVAVISMAFGSLGVLAIPAGMANAKVFTSYVTYNSEPPLYQPILCNENTSHYIDHPTEILSVQNNCSYRIFLHENRSGSGYNICISPGKTVFTGVTYRQLQVTGNKSPC